MWEIKPYKMGLPVTLMAEPWPCLHSQADGAEWKVNSLRPAYGRAPRGERWPIHRAAMFPFQGPRRCSFVFPPLPPATAPPSSSFQDVVPFPAL